MITLLFLTLTSEEFQALHHPNQPMLPSIFIYSMCVIFFFIDLHIIYDCLGENKIEKLLTSMKTKLKM